MGGIAYSFKCGIHVDSFFQSNLVDLQIKEATISLLCVLEDAVLFLILGATNMSADSTVSLVKLQSDLKTLVGF